MDHHSSKIRLENKAIQMKILEQVKDTHEPDKDSSKDGVEDSRIEPSQGTTTQNHGNKLSEKSTLEMKESNTGIIHADDSSTIPASSSSNNWDIPITSDPYLPPSSQPPLSKGTPKQSNRYEGRRRTFRLSRKQKEAVKKNAKLVSKKFLMFLVSHVGLTCLVVAYSIMGGFIFQALEASNEVKSITHIQEIRKRHVSKLWNVTDELNIFDPFLWREKANEVLSNFQLEIYESVKDKGWDGTDNVTSQELQWTFAGSLLYSVTVITTIGYGHLTPKTMLGRVVTMMYALVGIPMTLLCLANIGSFMARCFRLLWKQIVCKPCRNRIKRRSMYMAAKKKAATAVYIANMAKQKRPEGDGVEARTVGVGSRLGQDDVTVSCSNSPAVVHDGTALLGKGEGNAACSPLMSGQGRYTYGYDGLKSGDSVSGDLPLKRDSFYKDAASPGEYPPYTSSEAHPKSQVVSQFKDGANFPMMKGYEKSEGPVICPEIAITTPTDQPDPQVEDVSLEVKKSSKVEVVRVPIMVCLVMVAAYIVLGAVLFSLWEHWNYFDSSYFCFITLSTIGFGDIVPGYEHNTWDNQAKRVSCTLYLLFGLALVAMCFDLIQTECREIFNDLAKALGFADDDNE